MQEFYGGNPQDWLHVPQALLKAYAEMLPRLRSLNRVAFLTDLRMAFHANAEQFSDRVRDIESGTSTRHVATNPDDDALAMLGIAAEPEKKEPT